MGNIIWTKQVIHRNTSVYTCISSVTFDEKEAMNLKESGEGHVGEFGERKRKGEMM